MKDSSPQSMIDWGDLKYYVVETVRSTTSLAESVDKIALIIEQDSTPQQLKDLTEVIQGLHAEMVKANALSEYYKEEETRRLNVEESDRIMAAHAAEQAAIREHELNKIKLRNRNSQIREFVGYIIGGSGLLALLLKELVK